MLNKVLDTPVDTLVELVRKNENCSISFLKNNLKVSVEIIEKWLVILEEYEILKVQYNGLEGYVKLGKKEKENIKKKEFDLERLKDIFIESSKKKKISYEKMKKIWPLFLIEKEEEIKKLFYEKAKNLKINENKTKKAWEKYKTDIEVF